MPELTGLTHHSYTATLPCPFLATCAIHVLPVPPVPQTLCAVPEYDELPVRHNEDKLNAAMGRDAR